MSPVRQFWLKHRTLFWTLHSVWAFATGVVVVVLARERYGFVPWVVLFLGLTWLSAIFFGRRLGAEDAELPAAKEEFASYITRTLYQETLFFLLPFYAYSTVVDSANVLFTGLLAALAVFSCVDLVFDRLLRRSPLFGLLFFATVAFAAVNLLLPILLTVPPRFATALALGIAVLSAIPLVVQMGLPSGRRRLSLGLGAAAIITLVLWWPALVPPVPLRMDRVVFSSTFDRATITPGDSLPGLVPAGTLGGELFVLLTVFAPSNLPTAVSVEWTRDGQPIRRSRDIEITAHDLGFRIWEVWRPDSGVVDPGRYRVIVRTTQGRVFGTAGLSVGTP